MKLKLISEDAQQYEINAIKNKIEELSEPSNIQNVITKLKVSSIDELISKLEQDHRVQAILKNYQIAKSGHQKVREESWIGRVAGRFMTGIWKILTKTATYALNTIGNTILKVLMPFHGKMDHAPTMAKITYAGTLLLTAGISSVLISGGMVGPALIPWGLLWFGWNFIEPILPNRPDY